MKNTTIKSKDIDPGTKEYTIRVRNPDGAREMPGECGGLQDLIAMGVLPIRGLVDVLDVMLENNALAHQSECIITEQIRRLVQDLEDALYRFDDGVTWNIPKELEPIFETLESIPGDKLPEIQEYIKQFIPEKLERAA